MSQPAKSVIGRTVVAALGSLGVGALAGALLLGYTSRMAHQSASTAHTYDIGDAFPVSVDPAAATITPSYAADTYYRTHLEAATYAQHSWWNRLTRELQTYNSFQMLASPVSRVFVVWAGERTAMIANNIGDVVGWTSAERQEFIALVEQNESDFTNGYIMPGQYLAHQGATPQEVVTLLQNKFNQDVRDRYTVDVSEQVSMADALIIAALIEREASDFTNMREVSGVIWNRLFIDMPLQLDASLQYVKTKQAPYGGTYWPAVRPADKFLDSPYNTYQHTGLTPSPIANPSPAAVLAALNPIVTDCLYYFHGPDRAYYCSVDYKEHKRKIREVY